MQIITFNWWPCSYKNEAGLIFLVLGHNSIYSLDRHLLAKYLDESIEDFQCPSHFKCTSSHCTPIRHASDGSQDCPYGEGETQC